MSQHEVGLYIRLWLVVWTETEWLISCYSSKEWLITLLLHWDDWVNFSAGILLFLFSPSPLIPTTTGKLACSCTMVQGQGKKWLPKKEEAYEHAQMWSSTSAGGGCLFLHEAGIANSCRILHLCAMICVIKNNFRRKTSFFFLFFFPLPSDLQPS